MFIYPYYAKLRPLSPLRLLHPLRLPAPTNTAGAASDLVKPTSDLHHARAKLRKSPNILSPIYTVTTKPNQAYQDNHRFACTRPSCTDAKTGFPVNTCHSATGHRLINTSKVF